MTNKEMLIEHKAKVLKALDEARKDEAIRFARFLLKNIDPVFDGIDH